MWHSQSHECTYVLNRFSLLTEFIFYLKNFKHLHKIHIRFCQEQNNDLVREPLTQEKQKQNPAFKNKTLNAKEPLLSYQINSLT